jgi:hypothetical protein
LRISKLGKVLSTKNSLLELKLHKIVQTKG